ncbi:MAG: ABC-2 family transporter protein [Thermomicrobiales bacterium]
MIEPPQSPSPSRSFLARTFNPGLLDVFRMGIRRTYAFRTWLYLGILQVFFQLLLVKAIWKAVYGNAGEVNGVSVNTMITYLTVVGMINFMIYPIIADEIHTRIDDGQVAIDMVRPIGFIRQMLALELGNSIGRWMLLVVVVPGLLLLGSLTPPSPEAFAVFLLSFALAFAVSIQIWLLVGLSAFWLLNIGGMRSMVGLIGGFFAGSLIPLWFMPGPLRTISEWLPFQAIAYLPASIYTEQATGAAMWRAIGIQAFWLVLLGIAVGRVWHRAQNRLVVQGG